MVFVQFYHLRCTTVLLLQYVLYYASTVVQFIRVLVRQHRMEISPVNGALERFHSGTTFLDERFLPSEPIMCFSNKSVSSFTFHTPPTLN